MPRAPRGERVQDTETDSFIVVGRAFKGQAAPYFDRSRNVWVAPWTKPDGKTGRPTGRTRALAEASRDRHIIAAAAETAKFAPLAEGFHEGTTIAELSRWWLDNVARHRVRGTTSTTYDKQLRLVAVHVRRGSTYADRIGMVLGPTKTSRTAGRQLLGPTVVELLRKHQARHAAYREGAGGAWPDVVFEGEHLDLVFTNPMGGPVLRQHVGRVIRKAASQIGLDPSQFGTHDGRLSRDEPVRVRRVRA